MTDINLNLDAKTLEACIKETYNFGANIYTNICDGSVTNVPWGSLDWFMLALLFGLLIIGAVLIITD